MTSIVPSGAADAPLGHARATASMHRKGAARRMGAPSYRQGVGGSLAPPMQRTPRPRFGPRRENPLPLLLLPVVIAMGGALVAMLLLPAAAGISAGVTRVDQRLTTLGDAFTRIPKFPERSTIYASDGKTVLATVYLDENREIVHLSDVSDIAQKDVLALEDDGFYQHGALNLPSDVRVLLANLSAGQ